MASSNADLKRRMATSRHEILSYKPGKAAPCDDERVVFPDKLVIGIFDPSWNTYNIDDLRRALHGDVEPSKLADKRQTSTDDQGEYLTDSISVIETKYDLVEGGVYAIVRDLAGKVGCMVLLIDPGCVQYIEEFITLIKEVTGHLPLFALTPDGDIHTARNELKQLGITEIYEVNPLAYINSDEEQLKWLNLLHGCLRDGDRAFATNDLKKICTNPRCKSLYEETKKEARREVQRLQTEKEDERARAEKEMRSLAAEMTKKFESKQQRVDALTDIVAEKGQHETTLKQQVEDLKKAREGDRARFEKEQLERENWKLRTKIRLESEIRSAEQKKGETHQWSFIPWGTYGKQAQGTSSSSSSSSSSSTGGIGSRDTLQAGEEPPDDEFANILKQIADDLYDEAKIDSLAGQLGILHGDIQRAFMTNVKFNRVTSDGTRHMLKGWRRGVSREEERMELRKALQAAKLVNIADLYLGEGNMTSKNQGDLTDGSKSKHPDQSPERSRENLNASDVTSEDVSSEEVHSGDNMTKLSSIQPSEQSSSHEMQDLPEDMSPGGKPNEESTILDKSTSLLTCQRPVLMKRPAVGERRHKRKQSKPNNLFK